MKKDGGRAEEIVIEVPMCFYKVVGWEGFGVSEGAALEEMGMGQGV